MDSGNPPRPCAIHHPFQRLARLTQWAQGRNSDRVFGSFRRQSGRSSPGVKDAAKRIKGFPGQCVWPSACVQHVRLEVQAELAFQPDRGAKTLLYIQDLCCVCAILFRAVESFVAITPARALAR